MVQKITETGIMKVTGYNIHISDAVAAYFRNGTRIVRYAAALTYFNVSSPEKKTNHFRFDEMYQLVHNSITHYIEILDVNV